MPTFNDAESASSVRTKINDAITELEAARGGMASLTARIDQIHAHSSSLPLPIVVGEHYDASLHTASFVEADGVAGRIELVLWQPGRAIRIDRAGVVVVTGVASAQGKALCYAADATSGWPTTLLWETGNLDLSTGGYRFEARDFTFARGTWYWLGLWTSSTARVRCISPAGVPNLGFVSESASAYANVLRRTVTYGTATPAPWVYNAAERVNTTAPPSIRFRAQAL